jgi:SEC-C motif
MPQSDVTQRPGRNEPCHCGSGRKYKQCCLGKDEEADRASRNAATPETPAEPVEAPAADAPKAPAASTPGPRNSTRQPWKARTMDTRGFQKVNVPRRSGGS